MNRFQFRFIFSNGRKIFLTMIRRQIASKDFFFSTSELWFPFSHRIWEKKRERERRGILSRVSLGFKVSHGAPFFRDRAADVRGLSQFSCWRICRVSQMLLFVIFTLAFGHFAKNVCAINGGFTYLLLPVANHFLISHDD